MKKNIVLLAVLAFATITVVAISFLYKEKAPTVTNFTECAKYYPVRETYPETCVSGEGKTYVKEIPTITQTPIINMANPAAVFCENNGGTLETIPDELTGTNITMCTLLDGKVCEEWAYFRGECR
jgi:putative hemolysin